MRNRWVIVATLGSTQTLAWASSFYLPAVLAVPMAHDIGLSPAWIFAGLSAGLGISAFFGPKAGHLIDAHGGRPVLCASNVLFALGLVMLASVPDTEGGAYLVGTIDLNITEATGIYQSFVGGHNTMVDIGRALADGSFIDNCFCNISRP